ncbi:hypothetical protein O3P69_001845 [Scylla paramamosain]|uniref:Alpha-1,3-mannosyl-glycoprotein 2-beta-N-acetylglucosaminyltransferase n=1 Tax=Scylla paramamosain TaxID=85552 RepID=A0AAW0V0X6_SCYPA
MKTTTYLTTTLMVALLPQVEEVDVGGVTGWGGVHVAVLHPASGVPLASRSLPTAKPSEARVLARFLGSLQPGRILVLAVLADGALYLSPAEDTLRRLGFRAVVEALGVGEAWVGVTDGRLTREVVLPSPPPSSYDLLTQPRQGRTVAVTQVFLAKRGMRCPWHRRPEMRAQREFCDTYEGFSELCRCRDPLTPALARAAALLQMPGGGQTPFLVALEGESAAIRDLAELFGIPCSEIQPHQHQGNGTRDHHHHHHHHQYDSQLQAATQVIADVTRHALAFAFAAFPQARKVIFLEDDVLPSPDFLWFFQQTAALLDEDPTLLAVTAHNTYSVAGRGLDPTRLLRGAMPPQWGWMADRRLLEAWVPENWGDWDYWVLAWSRAKGLDVVFPELSRSLHAGSGGTHIDGFHQGIAFDHQAAFLPAPIPPATPMPSSVRCLDLYADDPRCDFEHVQQLTLGGHRLFLVDCPASPHCPQNYLAVPHNDLLMEAVAALDLFRRGNDLRTPFRVRRESRSVSRGDHLRERCYWVQPPLAGPQNSQQLQQGGAVAGAGVGGRGSVPSLLKPYSERRVQARGRGRVTAQAMRGENDDEEIKGGHYTSCVLPPCLVSDPLLHPNTLPTHLQPPARLALREAGATHQPASEFTVPDYFKNVTLFSAFYRYY